MGAIVEIQAKHFQSLLGRLIIRRVNMFVVVRSTTLFYCHEEEL